MTNAIREALAGLLERHCDGSNELHWSEWDTAKEALASLEQASTPSVEAVAWAASDWMRSITETELAGIPNTGGDNKGRRDRVRAMYRIPLYTHPPIPAPESAESICRCDLMCNRIAHGLPLSRETPKGAEQPAPQTESGADALRGVEYAIRRLQADIDDGSRPDQWSMEDIVRQLQPARAALADAEPTNSKGAEPQ